MKILKKITSAFLSFLIIFYSLYFPTFLPWDQELAEAYTAGNARAFYIDNNQSSPDQLRTAEYSGSSNSWGSEATANQTTNTTINNVVVVSSPEGTYGRDEKLVGVWADTSNSNESEIRVFKVDSTGASTLIYNTTVGADIGANIQPLDIAYEYSSGDALIAYTKGQANTDEVAYLVWNGTSMSSENLFDVDGTTATVCGIQMESRGSGSDRIGMVYSVNATTNSLNGAVWNGSSWESNPSTPLESLALEPGTACNSRAYDIEFEDTSGDILVAWGRNLGTAQFAYSTCNSGIPCTWSTAALVTAEDATALDLARLPGTNEILVGMIGNLGNDLGAGHWDGSTWDTLASDIDAAAADPDQTLGAQSVAVGWVSFGGFTRGVIVYADGAAAGQDFAVWNGTGFSLGTDCGSLPGVLEKQIKLKNYPNDPSQLLVLTKNNNADLFANRFTFDGSNVTCDDAGTGGTALNADVGVNTSRSFDVAFDKSQDPIVTVDSTGSQASTLPVGGTSKHVGGAFTFVRAFGSTNVTSITISDTGDINANTNLSNVEIYYKQEATCSTSIPAGATLFNSTPGTFNGSEQSTVTGTMSVGTSQMCAYLSLNISTGASVGETIEIQITNPSTEIVVEVGSVSPESSVAISGTTTLANPVLTVSTTETQKDEMGIPSDDNYIGAAFSFVRDATSTTVTSIKFTETGTVDADVELSNIDVYYKEETSCSSTVPGDATLFNSSTGSFVAADTVTVTGSMTIDTDRTCVYFTLNIEEAADDGDELEIEIIDPSIDVVVSSNTVAPATGIVLSGTTSLVSPIYTSYGSPFVYTQANWGTGGSDFFFELYWRKTVGNVYARVYDETAASEVTDSLVYISDTSFVRTRTSALALTDGHIYVAQLGHVSGASGEAYGARLIADSSGGGADLAEFYSSKETLDLAEVVSLDPEKPGAVKKTTEAYQTDMLGIVSTQPGIILGKNIGQSYPVGLVGRVPVKVTTENGSIRSGDYLTSASTDGYAMKATRARRVLGQALESLDETKLSKCPGDAPQGVSCGTVMIFLKLTNYLGTPVEIAMQEKNSSVLGLKAESPEENQIAPIQAQNSTHTSSGIPSASFSSNPIATSTGTLEMYFAGNETKEQQILAFLEELNLERIESGRKASEIFIDRLAAAQDIFAPQIYSRGLTVETATASGNLRVKGNGIFEGVLSVVDSLVTNNFIANGLSTFFGETVFKDKVSFEQVPVFNQNNGGKAVIKKGKSRVVITFAKEYEIVPEVAVSLSFEKGMDELADSSLEAEVANNAPYFFVTKKTSKGFEILLNKEAQNDMVFSWIALSVKDAMEFTSNE